MGDAGPARPVKAVPVWRRPATLILAAGAAAYAAGAATTTPFTWPANVVTGVPIVAFAAGVLWRWPLHPHRTVEAGRSSRSGVAWGVAFAVVVAWELVEYFAPGSRAAHPTLSSMADAVDRHRVAKAVVFWAWLCLGAWILSAGSDRTSAPPS